MGKPLLGMNERYGVASLARDCTEEQQATLANRFISSK
jgi:hypothetical protein